MARRGLHADWQQRYVLPSRLVFYACIRTPLAPTPQARRQFGAQSRHALSGRAEALSTASWRFMRAASLGKGPISGESVCGVCPLPPPPHQPSPNCPTQPTPPRHAVRPSCWVITSRIARNVCQFPSRTPVIGLALAAFAIYLRRRLDTLARRDRSVANG